MDKLSPSLAPQYGSAQSTELRRDACIPNTRVDLLSQLRAWTEDSNSKRIYWLNGMAGTGKTTIAYSLCEHLESNVTLAASFFCSRQLPTCRDASMIVPTVAYQLARFSLPFRHALSSALEQAPDVHGLKVSKQFQKLIVEPLMAIRTTLPPDLVVVIDALDECDNRDGVDQILETLLAHAPRLPIKFFVTSRPEARIQDQMRAEQSRGVPMELDLHNLEHSVVREDIKTYLKVKLNSPRLTLTDTNHDKLVDQSGVLFIYAATVVRYIEVDNFSRSAKRLAQVLSASTSSHTHSSVDIDALYKDILKAAHENNNLDDSERREMEDVLHTVICAQEPLTARVVAALLKLDVDSVQAALRPLSSVLHVSSEANGVITTFHESFPDYMLDKDRSGAFSCNAGKHNALLARRCFDVIGRCTPLFNICDLESSYVFDWENDNDNDDDDADGYDSKVEDGEDEEDEADDDKNEAENDDDEAENEDDEDGEDGEEEEEDGNSKKHRNIDFIPGLDQRVETAISSEMFYACQHWGPHIVLGVASQQLLNDLHEFLSTRLLLWMEVMNLKRRMSTGVGVLHWVHSWLQVSSSIVHA